MIGPNAQVMTGEVMKEHLRKNGICEKCGETKVKNREFLKKWHGGRKAVLVPITNSEVYKGKHIICHGGHEALIKSLQRNGEDVEELQELWQEYKRNTLINNSKRQKERQQQYKNDRHAATSDGTLPEHIISQSPPLRRNPTHDSGSASKLRLSDSSHSYSHSHSLSRTLEQEEQEIKQRIKNDMQQKRHEGRFRQRQHEQEFRPRKEQEEKPQQKRQDEELLQMQRQHEQQRLQMQMQFEQELRLSKKQEEMAKQKLKEKEEILQQQQQQQQQTEKAPPIENIVFQDDNGTIISSLPDEETLYRQKNFRDTTTRPSTLSERVPTEDLTDVLLKDLEDSQNNPKGIFKILRENKCKLPLIYAAFEYLLNDSVPFKNCNADWIVMLHEDILSRHFTNHKNITIHTLDILIKCISDCHQFQTEWNDLIFTLCNKILSHYDKDVEVLVRTCTLIGCVFQSYYSYNHSSTSDNFKAQEDILHGICQSHTNNEYVLGSACTAWMFMIIYNGTKQPRLPTWMELALGRFPDNTHLWTCLCFLCKHTTPTPDSMSWIKEILIQNFPPQGWSDTQAWCLYNASIYTNKSPVLSPRSFWIITASLIENLGEDSIMNILNLWHSEHIAASSFLEENIVQLMRRFPDSIELQEAACTLLARIEISSSDTVIDFVSTHIKKHGLQTAAFCTLQNYLQSKIVQDTKSHDVIKGIILTLKPILSTSQSRKAASLLWTLCCYGGKSDYSKDIATSCGELILSMSLTNHTDDDQILGLLAYLVYATPDEMAAHLSDKVNEIINVLLRTIRISADQNMVELSCAIIASFSNNNVWKLFLLHREDLFSTLLACIDKFPGSLKYDVFCIIYNLAMQPEDILSILSFDALNHILKSLLDNQVVCENEEEDYTLKALIALLPCTAPQYLVNGKGLVDSIFHILERRLNEEIASQYCLIALWNLLFKVKEDVSSDKFKDIIAAQDIISIIISAMSNHLGCEILQEKACMILWNLSDSDNYVKSLIADADGINTALIAMQCHMKCLALQEAGLGLLTGMACVPRIRNKISLHGGIDIVMSVVWVNVEQESIVSNGLIAMSNISVNSENNQIDLVGHAEIELIITAMSNFPFSSSVQVAACRLLRNLSLAVENIRLMIQFSEQLTGALTEAAYNFPGECRERVDFVLDRILVT